MNLKINPLGENRSSEGDENINKRAGKFNFEAGETKGKLLLKLNSKSMYVETPHIGLYIRILYIINLVS